MKTISIELTDSEYQVFKLIAADPTDCVTNAAKERCRIAIDEIVSMVVQKCLNERLTIPSTREEMVALAIANGWVGQPPIDPIASTTL